MKNIKKIFACAILLAGLSLSLPSCSENDGDNGLVAVPQEYETALKQMLPDVRNVQWETAGEYRVAEFVRGEAEYDVWFDSKVDLAMTKQDFGRNFYNLPDNDMAIAFPTSEYGSWVVDDISYYEQRGDEFYVVEVEKYGEPDMELFFTTGGGLITAIRADAAPDVMPNTSVLGL